MSNKFEEVTKDVAELRTLVASASRKRNQDFLAMELRKMETELKELQEKEIEKSNTEKSDATKQTKNTPRVYTVNIRNYSWDQSDKFVKLYITLKNIQSHEKEKISVQFEEKSVNLSVSELDGKNQILKIMNLAARIKPDASHHKVKTDMIVIFMAKEVQKKWEAVTELDAKASEARKPKMDSSDPNNGMMDLMKQMYVDGDDKMKQMLNKTMYENQQKKLTGEEGDMSGMGGGMPGMGGMGGGMPGMPGMGGMGGGMPGMAGMGEGMPDFSKLMGEMGGGFGGL